MSWACFSAYAKMSLMAVWQAQLLVAADSISSLIHTPKVDSRRKMDTQNTCNSLVHFLRLLQTRPKVSFAQALGTDQGKAGRASLSTKCQSSLETVKVDVRRAHTEELPLAFCLSAWLTTRHGTIGKNDVCGLACLGSFNGCKLLRERGL